MHNNAIIWILITMWLSWCLLFSVTDKAFNTSSQKQLEFNNAALKDAKNWIFAINVRQLGYWTYGGNLENAISRHINAPLSSISKTCYTNLSILLRLGWDCCLIFFHNIVARSFRNYHFWPLEYAMATSSHSNFEHKYLINLQLPRNAVPEASGKNFRFKSLVFFDLDLEQCFSQCINP